MKTNNVKRRIAPRLASGNARVPFGHGLPDGIKEGLREIARMEGASMSWVLEELITDWLCNARRVVEAPEYKPRKTKGLEDKPVKRSKRSKKSKPSRRQQPWTSPDLHA